jgi:hypothetical protein
MGPLVQDVEPPLPRKGPWPSVLSELYYPPEVTAAVEALRAAEPAHGEVSRLAA